MPAIELIKDKGHERVSVRQDPDNGLVSIIAVHSTVLGPGLGGCRMYPYETLEDAMTDVLRLSEGMTYKNALCGLNLGGGKAVIVADRDLDTGRENLYRSFGRFVESMQGAYVTAEDMGTTEEDMEVVATETAHVTGRNPKDGGAGNPSPSTAHGVLHGMRACLERAFQTSDFSGKKVAIQGVGAVGAILCELLTKEGAELIVADTRGDCLDAVSSAVDVSVVSIDEIVEAQCDIFSPCARGGVLNEHSIPKLQCKVIAGAANNQLFREEDEEALRERGIMYAPDFAINAGGVILVGEELEEGGFQQSRVDERLARIYDTVGAIIDRSRNENALAGKIAKDIAIERIEAARS